MKAWPLALHWPCQPPARHKRARASACAFPLACAHAHAPAGHAPPHPPAWPPASPRQACSISGGAASLAGAGWWLLLHSASVPLRPAPAQSSVLAARDTYRSSLCTGTTHPPAPLASLRDASCNSMEWLKSHSKLFRACARPILRAHATSQELPKSRPPRQWHHLVPVSATCVYTGRAGGAWVTDGTFSCARPPVPHITHALNVTFPLPRHSRSKGKGYRGSSYGPATPQGTPRLLARLAPC